MTHDPKTTAGLDPDAMYAVMRAAGRVTVHNSSVGIKAAITAYLASRPGLWFVEKDGSMRAPTTKDI